MLRRQIGKGAIRGLKEEAAWAVVRDVWERGHRSVELRHDGRRAIFFCTICETRCYSDSALSDHLHGNVHAHNSNALEANLHLSDGGNLFRKSLSAQTFEREKGWAPSNWNDACSSPMLYEISSPPLEWVGDGQLFVRCDFSQSLRQIEAAWLRWCGKEQLDVGASENLCESQYAIAIFPYSDGLGRTGNKDALLPANLNKETRRTGTQRWPSDGQKSILQIPGHCKLPSVPLLEGKETPRTQGPSRGHRKKQSRPFDRLCFICRQQMVVGKDVAALLNARTGQFACGSRNWRGAFHVFHTSCLVDWLALFESKCFSGNLLGSSRKLRRRMRGHKKQGHYKQAEDAATEITCKYDKIIFCPECQGTGTKASDVELERPRYRLAQVFDCILELVQARQAWIDHPEEQMESITGLLFLTDTDQDESKMCVTECRGIVKCYVSGSSVVWAANALDRKHEGMELDP